MKQGISNTENTLKVLGKYVPEHAAKQIVPYLEKERLLIKIKNSRASKLGDYRPLINSKFEHQITINHDLNPYSFLITLIHELAHMHVNIKYKGRQQPHGERWKVIYASLLSEFLKPEIFPEEILIALEIHLTKPTASSCTDYNLHAVLRKYDSKKDGKVFLSTLESGSHFRWNNNRIFKKSEKLRTRYRCEEIPGGKIYLFHPMAEVELMN